MRAERLATRIMPLVRRSRPGVRLLLVGQGPSPSLVARGDGALTLVTGAVEDVRPYLSEAAVACLPLVSGSGTKYKLLEALSAGTPVVCSPLAAEGLSVEHERHLLLAESDEGMAAAILRLLAQPADAVRLAHEGRRLVEARYAWDAILARLDPWLQAVSERPRSRAVW